MPYATYRFNKIIAADTIRFIVTVAIVVYKGLIPVVGRILTVQRAIRQTPTINPTAYSAKERQRYEDVIIMATASSSGRHYHYSTIS